MRVIIERIDALGATLGNVVFVCKDGVFIAFGSVAVAADSAAADANTVEIKSPMVGTFYRSSNPDAEPFVKVGDKVGPESVVCIVEAMKVFNEILAEVSGEIVAILAENEEAVEFGRPLFKVDTSK